MLATAQQDITKFGPVSAAQVPSLGALQCAPKKGSYRFKLYEKKDSQLYTPAQNQQTWRQFSGRNKCHALGCGVSNAPISLNIPREASRVNDNCHALDPLDS